jgi:hypothetical protein
MGGILKHTVRYPVRMLPRWGPHHPTLGRELPSRRPRGLLDEPPRAADRPAPKKPYTDDSEPYYTDVWMDPPDEGPVYTEGESAVYTEDGKPTETAEADTKPAAKAAAKAAARPVKAVVPGAVQGVCAGMYQAMEAAGRFGIIDLGERTRGHAVLLVHAPRRNREGIPDLRPGEVITARPMHGHRRETQGAMSLPVGFVTRSRYFRPGTLVTSCIIGVPAHAWPFAYATGV